VLVAQFGLIDFDWFCLDFGWFCFFHCLFYRFWWSHALREFWWIVVGFWLSLFVVQLCSLDFDWFWLDFGWCCLCLHCVLLILIDVGWILVDVCFAIVFYWLWLVLLGFSLVLFVFQWCFIDCDWVWLDFVRLCLCFKCVLPILMDFCRIWIDCVCF